MAIAYLLLLVAVLFAFKRVYTLACVFLLLGFLLSVGAFLYHANSSLTLRL